MKQMPKEQYERLLRENVNFLLNRGISEHSLEFKHIKSILDASVDFYYPVQTHKFFGLKNKPETPKVGVGVIVRDPNGQILMMLRKGSHGAGLWSLPGGHMELGEDFLTTCQREVLEETGVTITDVIQVGFTNDVFEKEGLHYITLFFEAVWDPYQSVTNMEPDKCEQILWLTKEQLEFMPNVFSPLAKILKLME
jgi:8-oxo-dGTP diphosphatase